jgi:hypothetical protein
MALSLLHAIRPPGIDNGNPNQVSVNAWVAQHTFTGGSTTVLGVPAAAGAVTDIQSSADGQLLTRVSGTLMWTASPTLTGQWVFDQGASAHGAVITVNSSGSAASNDWGLLLAGDFCGIEWMNTASAIVGQIGTVKAWVGSGADTTDFAVGAISALKLYAGAQTSAAGLTIDSTGFNLFGRGVALCKFKGSTTSRNTQTVPSNDPDLQIALAATSTYAIEVYVHVNTSTTTTQGLVFNINYSGTITVSSLGSIGFTNGASIANGAGVVDTTVTPRDFPFPNIAVGSFDWVLVKGYITTNAAGTLAFSWAQDNSSANNTSVIAGSYMKVTQVS